MLKKFVHKIHHQLESNTIKKFIKDLKQKLTKNLKYI